MIRRLLTGAIILIAAVVIIFIGASYYYVHIFMHPSKKIVINGVLQLDSAKKKRQEIIDTYDTKTVSFMSEDGISLAGLLIKRPNAKRNVVLSHGYRGLKEMLHDFIPLFLDANVLLFDFRGHGQSGDSLITFGYNESRDVRAAAKFMKSEIKKELPLVLFGVSMGGVAVIKAAADYPDLCDAVISDSAYTTLYSMVKRIAKRLLGHTAKTNAFSFNQDIRPTIPFFLYRPFVFFVGMLINISAGSKLMSFDLIDWVKRLTVPLLIIHSEDDEVISVKNAQKISEAAHNTGVHFKLWVGPSAEHGMLRKVSIKEYGNKISEVG